MKRMLINATQPEELRVAIADGQTLLDLDIEVPAQEQKKANIYKGRITRVEPSLDACFVEFGSERHGFLSMKEISREYFSEAAIKQLEAGERVEIKDAVSGGQEIIVQVDKEERGTKGAALTTFISLAGRYLVLMPNNPRAGGVSRQITRDERKELLETLSAIRIPEGMGAIVRTAGVGRDSEELQWDLDYLLHLWSAIQEAARSRKAPFLIYQESNLIIRALRDYLREDIGEILIDDEKVFEDAREFMQQVMPHNLRKLKTYNDATPLFSRFQIESQIESAFAREVRLPSGGALVIDHTEALLSIDINSARATKGADIEETALQTNLEAADELARQLRLRDLGGLVVVDFIDMMSKDAQRQVENRLRDAMRMDKARVQIGRISRFGLLEMSRQRLRPSLGESSYITCPRCDGYGAIRSIESLALSILRLAEEESMKEHTSRVIVQAPIEVGNFLLNEKRDAMAELEQRNKVPITIVANRYLETPRFDIQRLRSSESIDEPSYALATGEDLEATAGQGDVQGQAAPPPPPPPAAVSGVRPRAPAPARKNDGFIARLIAVLRGWFGGGDDGEGRKQRGKQRRHDRKRSGKAVSGQHRRPNRGKPQDGKGKSGPEKSGSPARKKKGSKKKAAQARKGPDDSNRPSDGGTPEAPKKKKKRRRRGGKKRRARGDGQQQDAGSGKEQHSQGSDKAQQNQGSGKEQQSQAEPQSHKRQQKQSQQKSRPPQTDSPGKGEQASGSEGKVGGKEQSGQKADDTASSSPTTAPAAQQPVRNQDDAAKRKEPSTKSHTGAAENSRNETPAPAAEPKKAPEDSKSTSERSKQRADDQKPDNSRSGESSADKTSPQQQGEKPSSPSKTSADGGKQSVAGESSTKASSDSGESRKDKKPAPDPASSNSRKADSESRPQAVPEGGGIYRLNKDGEDKKD
ncbi:Rne/Rng family ribonuclease [Wenzhouxiangella sp. AB-CW3]|uniref:Rne/Rng family ribonuclease n=1 Tax=Wenzhouxiangella sp. AB-CW3 TaxID=2771012 RepID=UPI00168BD853|nr:Rne/Rng family ribonuclease [Wenzhouxiangella sp. AB-CW3]QOC21114.1 Rne/Rng family ribonuclease [Wenzhouxiangella sp. AB-CW3]